MAAGGDPEVSIVIPTFRRPDRLLAAARSALAQTRAESGARELVIVDNDPEGSAAAAIETLKAEAAIPVIAVHQPRPGVASARNAGVAAARGGLIAFLDDDETAPPGWLDALLAARAAHDADVAFGPVRTRLPDAVTAHRDYFSAFFARTGPAQSGVIEKPFGCGNSLLRRAALPDPKAPFDPACDESGGEDDLLFAQMGARGARFAWAAEAWVWEAPDAARLTLAYALRRAFAYGQGPSEACAAAKPPQLAQLAFWMLVGFGQAAVYGLLAGPMWLLRLPGRAKMLDRAARGAGKLFWFPPFTQRFYGG
ncbi:MAG: glycosyltransferase family 2 protein [Maricaulaceae bacterium]|nr:glycosyltransferase family 2 protein [Maricaulaceae bacterium]